MAARSTSSDRGSADCGRCAAALPQSARFCPRCGAPTLDTVIELERAEEEQALGATRLVLGLVAAYGGTLVAIALAWELSGSGLAPQAQVALWNAGLLGAALAGALLLGGGALRASLGGRPAPRWLPLGAAAGLATFAVGWAYVELVARLSGASTEVDERLPALTAWVAVVVAPPLVEEWLCRGVLWEASRRAAGSRTALVATSVLFAFLHGPGSGTLGLPHRLVAGGVFGWLRLRSGSLLPGVLAHAVNNAIALALLVG